MAVATPAFYMDFNRSGSFVDDAAKDITDQVKRFEISLGKSKDYIERYVVGTCVLTVKNEDGWWSGKNFGGTSGGQVTGYRTTLANHQPVVEADVVFATPTAAGQWYAQAFKNGAGRWCDRVDVRLKRTGSPGGTVTAYFYRNTGSVPDVQKDNFAVSRAVTIADIGTSYEWVTFEFEKSVPLPADTTYWVVLKTSGYTRSAGTAELAWGANGASGFAGGHSATYNGTAWSWLRNGISNPSFESAATGWTGLNSTVVTRITTDGYDGSACLQVDPPGSVGTEGALFGSGAVSAAASTAYTFRVAVKGTAGRAYRLAWDENNGGAYLRTKTSAAQTLVGSDWNWFTLSATTGASVTNLNLYIYHDAVNSTRFFIDKAQFSADSAPQGDLKFRITSNDIELRALKLWVTMTYGVDTDYRFYGQLARWEVNPDPRKAEATLTFKDPMAEMEKSPLNVSTLHRNRYLAHQSEGSMLGDVLTAAGYSSSNWSIGSETLVVPYAVYPRMTQGQAIAKVTEAGGGFFFFQATSEANGYVRPTYRSSNYENLNASLESWGDDVMLNAPSEQEQEERQLSTQLIVTVNPRRPDTKIADVGEYATPVRFGGSEQKTIWLELREACTSIVSMVSGVDYTSGFTLNSQTNYAGSGRVKVVITAPVAGGTLTVLKVRGIPVPSVDQYTVQVDDSDAQAVTWTADGTGIVAPGRLDNEFIQTQLVAESAGRRLVERNLREPTWLTVSRNGARAANYPSMLNRMVGDIVTLVFPTTKRGANIGVNGDYMIESIKETGVVKDGTHVIEYRLREVGRAPKRRFGYSAAGRGYSSGAVLGP